MRPYKPAPKNSSANRIRERYLNQLGLQRKGVPLVAPHLPSNHVVDISGLPSLPEDRATTDHGMESHDFSISKRTRDPSTTPGSADEISCEEYDDNQSDCGSARQTTLSASPNQATRAGNSLLHMALAYPTAVLKAPPDGKSTPPPSPLSRPMHWRNTLSQSACVLLDMAEYHHVNNDHDSVSSVGTSTTAESTAMISRDWGAYPPTTSAGVSISTQGGESPASAPGVYFHQCGHPRLALVGDSQGGNFSTSSLVHELNRFSIDSDCEASVTSNHLAEDRIMDEDDTSIDDTVVSRVRGIPHEQRERDEPAIRPS
ncbi:hypothetical protein ACHAXA_000962 [Cyclostephanos tholiformis]|uniref:Uncharacterized protein n=1 Tax=Cyclostephanos tholiformis TaxID=382380 RepID=A0ABD3R5V5_9STRA